MSTYDVERLVENFQFIGLTPDDAVLAKCIELCITHGIGEEELVDLWAAFSISNLKNAPPSVDGLELLERKELSKKQTKNSINGAAVVKTPERKKAPPPKSNYASPAQKTTQPSTPIQATQALLSSQQSDIDKDAYGKRTLAGKVVDKHNIPNTDRIDYSTCMSAAKVKLFGDEAHWMPRNAQQLYCHVQRQRESRARITEYVAEGIAQKHGITLETHFDRNSAAEIFYGTIACERSTDRLSRSTVQLELPGGDYSSGEKIALDMSQLTSYALFPGQVVVVEGRFVKDKLHALHLYTDAFTPPVRKQNLAAGLQIIVAAGPFTCKHNLLYEPLQDLLACVLEARPHVLILTGPFIDEEHECVETMTEPYDGFFHTLVESIMAPLEGMNIQVVLVASLRDVHHFPVYPTPPYDVPARYPNLLCAPDPCMLDIDGLHVGVTTADVLFHMGREDLLSSADGHRLQRLSRHLLEQQCFYPLRPKGQLPIDDGLLERYGLMETPPHLLIVPSNFRYFATTIEGCTVINPERLTKGYTGGKYASIQIGADRKSPIQCEIINI